MNTDAQPNPDRQPTPEAMPRLSATAAETANMLQQEAMDAAESESARAGSGQEAGHKKARTGFLATMRECFVNGRYERCHDGSIQWVLGGDGSKPPRGSQARLARTMSLSDQAISKWALGTDRMQAANWSLFVSLHHERLRRLRSPNLRERAIAGYRVATLEANRLLKRRGEQAALYADQLASSIAKGTSPAPGTKLKIQQLRRFAEMTARLGTTDDSEGSGETRRQLLPLLDMQFEILFRMIRLPVTQEFRSDVVYRFKAEELDSLMRYCKGRFPSALEREGIQTAEDLASYAETLAEKYLAGFLVAFNAIVIQWSAEYEPDDE